MTCLVILNVQTFKEEVITNLIQILSEVAEEWAHLSSFG